MRSTRTSKPRSILVVDDNHDLTDMLAVLLRADGQVVYVADDGNAALELARLHPIDVVFLDLGMPGMDGCETGRRLRAEHGRSLLLVALTGYGRDEDRARSREAGFDHHLVKPISIELLRDLLDTPNLTNAR